MHQFIECIDYVAQWVVLYNQHVSCCRITGEGRAEFLRAWGAGFEQEGEGGWGGGQLDLCVEAINPLRGQYLTVLEGGYMYIL